MTPSTYPKLGNAPDYSWIAGWVNFTRIQGGCIYIRTDAPPPTPGTAATGDDAGANTPVVATAVHSDTSPPLRDITPGTTGQTPQPITASFIPSGPGWDSAKFKDGDYVVAFGRVAGPGDVREMCPGGTQYIIDKMQPNP